MKKYLFFLLIIIITFSLCGCGIFNLTPETTTSPSPSPSNTVETIDIVFDINCYGISSPSTLHLSENGLITEPSVSNRPGYTLSGWYYYDDLSVKHFWDFNTNSMEEDTTLFAEWTLDEYTITFDLAGGEGTTPEPVTVSYLQKVTEPDMNSGVYGINNPVKNGFVFAGWWVGGSVDNYTQEWNFGTDLPSRDLTLHAGWGTAGSNDYYSYIELSNCIKITNCDEDEFLNDDMEDVNIPDQINGKYVLSIGKEAFSYLDASLNVSLPSHLTTINEKAFYSADGLEELTIPNSVTSIGEMAFHSCSLYKVNIGSGVTNIGKMAFYQCEDLANYSTATLIIPSNVLTIEDEAFNIASNSIYNLTLNNGLISIGDSAFMHAKILTLNIPDSVLRIDDQAFQYCEFLTKLEFGKGIQEIGTDAFNACANNLYVIMNSAIPPVIGNIAVFGTNVSRPNFYIEVPDGKVDVYSSSSNWSTYYPTKIIDISLEGLIIYPTR